MDLVNWDRHKVAAVTTGLLFLVLFASGWMTGDMEDRAMEEAAATLSQSEANTILRFFESYEQRLPSLYNTLDSLGTWLGIIVLLGSLYSAWTALDIPERYRKKTAPLTTTTPTTVPEPPE